MSGCGKPGHVTIAERLARKHGLGSNLDVTHADDFVADEDAVAAIDEALERAAREADKVAACNHEPDEADECPAGCHHSGAADVAARIRALKAQKAPH